MGTKYSTNATSGYNTLPPSDDGTVSESNKVKWATLKTKLADPIKTLADTINSELVTHFNNGPSAVTANTTLGASHYNQVIQASGAAVTLTLSDAATLLAGWYCWVRNTDTTESITIGRATAGDTFNGTAANYLLQPNEAIMIVCNAAANGFITTSLALGESQTFHGSTPAFNFRETDQTLPAGKFRIIGDGNTLRIDKNTVTAGDYSTYISSLIVNTDGTLTTEGAAPAFNFRETDQTLPAGKVRIIANGDTLKIEKNTATAGDYSTSVQSILVNADGTTTVNGAVNVQTFTASGTWTKPAGYGANSAVYVQAWGGGGGGANGNGTDEAGGGGGGAYAEHWFLLSDLGATETITIGAGGTGSVGAGNGTAGGNTTVGALLTAYGGGPGLRGTAAAGVGGGGGGAISVGGSNGGGILGGGTGGTGGAPGTNGGYPSTLFGGAGGAGGSTAGDADGGGAYWGGAGGGADGATASTGGTSVFGGAGGGSGVAGAQPGGGGNGRKSAAGTNGGAGKVIITVY